MKNKLDSSEKYAEAIIKEFKSIDSKYNTLELLYDWIDGQMGCLNTITGCEDGSKYFKYLNKAHKEHTNEQNTSYNKIFALLKEGVNKYKKDILGRVAFILAADNGKSMGLNLTESGGYIAASILLSDISDIRKKIDEQGYAEILIGGIGSGSVVLSCVEILGENGIDLNKVNFVASELDDRLAQMAIIQLSLLEVKAVVTLTTSPFEVPKCGYITVPLAYDSCKTEEMIANVNKVSNIQMMAMINDLLR